jgi:predicted negative regulator of RcsB-dependent stress response
MEFLIIALVIAAGVYFGYQYYLAKKAVIDPYVTKLSTEVKEAAKKVDVEKVLDVNNDGKVDIKDVTIIAEQATKAADTVKKTVKKATAKKAPAKKPAAKKKPNMKIVK